MSTTASNFYEFGPFRLDPVKRLLLREGTPVPLTSKAFDTLVALVEHGGDVLDKDTLMKMIWPETVVEEANLAQNVSVLRKALGERAGEHQYIVTIPGRGYSFVARVEKLLDIPTAGDQGRSGAAVETTKSGQSAEAAFAQRIEARKKLRAQVLIGCALAAAIIAMTFIWILNSPTERTSKGPIKSIAVLPFKPLVAGTRDELLELGMADALITKLSRLSRLVVRPTSAVRKYGGIEQDPLAAGREQKADLVLESTFQKSDDRLRVTARLLNVRDGAALWSETFDEKFTHIFAVQDSISERVAGSLALNLTGDEKQQLARRDTENTEAFQLYVKGRYFANQETTEGFKRAVEYVSRAIEIDPNYARAYAALSLAYHLASEWQLPPRDAMPKAKAAADHALKLDDKLPEAHIRLAWVSMHYDWDWPAAEKEFKRAIELNPNDAASHSSYAGYLSTMGRHDDAIAERNLAEELDPLSPQGGAVLYLARSFDAAIYQSHKALELNPNSLAGRQWLGMAYEQKGMYQEAIAEFQKCKALDDTPDWLAFLGHAYGVSGRRTEAVSMLGELKKRAKEGYVSPYYMALVYIGLGEKHPAIEWLERAFEDRSSWMISLETNPQLDSLRSDSRFRDLLRRVGVSR